MASIGIDEIKAIVLELKGDIVRQAREDALNEYATMLMCVFSHSCEFYFISDDWTIEAIEKDKIDDVILECLEKVKEQSNE